MVKYPKENNQNQKEIIAVCKLEFQIWTNLYVKTQKNIHTTAQIKYNVL